MRALILGFLLVVLVALGVVPDLGWGQFPGPPDDAGELVLAHTLQSSVLPPGIATGGGFGPAQSMQVWESGYAELWTTTVSGIPDGPNPTQVSIRVVPVEDVQQLKRDLIRLGILKLDGRVMATCTLCLAPFVPPIDPQRVTFIDRVPKWLHEYLMRHPKFYHQFKVYLRPREASFFAVPFQGLDPVAPRPPGDDAQTAFNVVNRINEFARVTFQGPVIQPPPDGGIVPSN